MDALSSALDRGNHGLENVPGLLKRVLDDDSWREFETARGEHVEHDRFESFVSSPPLRGLGASMEVIDRIVGHDDPDLMILLKGAKSGRRGRPAAGQKVDESSKISQDHDADDLVRMARDAPEEYAAVQRGEKSVNAAAVAAGIRRRRIPIRLDNAASAAETLRKHMPPEQLADLRRLLGDRPW